MTEMIPHQARAYRPQDGGDVLIGSSADRFWLQPT